MRFRATPITLLLLGAATAAPAHAAAVGDPIDEAIAVHITSLGLTHLGDAIGGVVPPSFTIEESGGEFECGEDSAPLVYTLGEMDVLLSVDDVDIRTADGRLDMTLYATLSSTPTELSASGDCSVLVDLEEVCALELPTTAVQFDLGLVIHEADGVFDVVVDTTALTISPIGNPLADCTLSSAIGTMLGQDPEIISGLIAGLIEPSLADLGPTIETSFEDALNALQLETSMDLLGTTLDVSVYPSLVQLEESGLVLGLGGAFDVSSLSECVDSSQGSDLIGSGWPEFGAQASSTSLEPDAALYVGRDFVDHALYTVWASGLLCLDIGDLMASALGTGLDGGFLGGLMGDEFAALVPEDEPVLLLAQPGGPPTVGFHDDGPPISIDINELELNLYAELDEHEARIFQVDVLAEVGLDVSLDEGALEVALDLGDDDLALVEAYSEMLSPGYSDGLGGLVDTALGSMLPDGPLLSTAIPAVLGIEVGHITWVPTADGAWQGGYVLLDTSAVTPIEVTGCSLDGLGCGEDGGTGTDIDLETMLGCSGEDGLGCSSEDGGGCETGGSCATAGHSHRVLLRAWRGRVGLLIALGLGFMVRRRQD